MPDTPNTFWDALDAAYATGQLGGGTSVVPHRDPLGIGFACTFDPITGDLNTSTNGGVNVAYFYKALGWGQTVSSLRINVGIASGNIDVGIYSGTGSGTSSLPSTLLGHTGSIACPTAGLATVSLLAPVTIPPGAWFAIVADNTTVTFTNVAAVVAALQAGRTAFQNTAFPLPATAAATSPINVARLFWIATP